MRLIKNDPKIIEFVQKKIQEKKSLREIHEALESHFGIRCSEYTVRRFLRVQGLKTQGKKESIKAKVAGSPEIQNVIQTMLDAGMTRKAIAETLKTKHAIPLTRLYLNTLIRSLGLEKRESTKTHIPKKPQVSPKVWSRAAAELFDRGLSIKEVQLQINQTYGMDVSAVEFFDIKKELERKKETEGAKEHQDLNKLLTMPISNTGALWVGTKAPDAKLTVNASPHTTFSAGPESYVIHGNSKTKQRDGNWIPEGIREDVKGSSEAFIVPKATPKPKSNKCVTISDLKQEFKKFKEEQKIIEERIVVAFMVYFILSFLGFFGFLFYVSTLLAY